VAYDPTVTAFILAGVVGAVAVVLGASSDWEATDELARATDRWTSPWLVRTYARDGGAGKRLAAEAAILRAHGYAIAFQRGVDGPGLPVDEAETMADAEPTIGPPRGRIVVTYQLG